MIERARKSERKRSADKNGSIPGKRERSLAITTNFFWHILPAKSNPDAVKFTATFYLGVLSFALFLILIITGVLISFYYHPSVPQAYYDMKDLTFAVSSGQFLRNMHRWAAHAMVIVVFLHILRVFYSGAYKTPKQFNWVVGIILFLLTLLLSYTGYLLPWDQLAYWAVSVGTNMVETTPLVGEKIKYLLLGGNEVGENTLIRFYVLHVFVLPMIMAILIGLHFWRVRKDGGVSPLEINTNNLTGKPQDEAVKTSRDKNFIMTYPDVIIRGLIVCEIMLIMLVLASLFFNAPLEWIANPEHTPSPAKAPWYFLGLQELLHYFQPVFAVFVIPTSIIIVLIAFPYFRINIKQSSWISKRRNAVITLSLIVALISVALIYYHAYAILVTTLIIYVLSLVPSIKMSLAGWLMTWLVLTTLVLTTIGVFFRGPEWQWIWPWIDGIY
jgi:quinol-cytochrome oxidoreductase complex cytochrome b subunit